MMELANRFRSSAILVSGQSWPRTTSTAPSLVLDHLQDLALKTEDVCTTQACDFRDNLASLQGSGYEVLGISPDAPEALARFTGDFALTFPLLADEDHAVALAYGAWGEKLVDETMTEGIVRSTLCSILMAT